MRRSGQSVIIVVVPRRVHSLLQGNDRILLDPQRLRESDLSLPEQLNDGRLRSLLTNEEGTIASSGLSLEKLLTDFPIAILYAVDSA